MSGVSLTAFAAPEDAKELSGSVYVSDEETIDVGVALEEGDGVIVAEVGSPRERALAGFDGLRRVSAPEAAVKAAGEAAGQPQATDAAHRRAGELGVDLGQVEGSGAGGKITLDDVAAASRDADDENGEDS